MYHHFPGGKSELLHAALDRASERALGADGGDPWPECSEVLDRFLALWRALLDYSSLARGAPWSPSPSLVPKATSSTTSATIFRTWTDLLAELFVAGGMPEDAAHRMATVTIAATEGAVVLSRAQQSRDPFDEVAGTLMDLVGGQT